MKNMEELFKKVNRDRIELTEHKDNLKRYLLTSSYFDKKENRVIDLKLIFSSVAFSFLLIFIVSVYFSSNYSKDETKHMIENFDWNYPMYTLRIEDLKLFIR